MKTIRISDRDAAIVLGGLRCAELVMRNKGANVVDFCEVMVQRTGTGTIVAEEIAGLAERIDAAVDEGRGPTT